MSENVRIVRSSAETIVADAAQIVMDRSSLGRLTEAIPNGDLIFLLAKTATGAVVGQVGINPSSPTRADTRQHIDYPTPAIAFMHVAEDRRRQGIGDRLLNEACAVAATELGARGVYLTVAAENTNAQNFYRHRG